MNVSVLVLTIFFGATMLDVGKHVFHPLPHDVLQNVSPSVFSV